MSENTKIEWCDATVNHWAGCTAVSPACDNCYAKCMAGRLWGTEWGQGKPRYQFAGASDTLRALDRKAKRLGQPLRVFHNSLSDFFDNEVPVAWRISAMQAIADTPNLIHLLLTKRIGNVIPMMRDALVEAASENGQSRWPGLAYWIGNWWDGRPPSNVWIGTTIVNQEEADRDIPKLLSIPAAKRFLSMEPLLGPVDLNYAFGIPSGAGRGSCPMHLAGIAPEGLRVKGQQHLHWVIVGGESGPGARPMHPDWARSLRDQCTAASVPFLFKQWGEWAPNWLNDDAGQKIPGSEWVDRMGKKIAGRLLDGVTHDGVPS